MWVFSFFFIHIIITFAHQFSIINVKKVIMDKERLRKLIYEDSSSSRFPFINDTPVFRNKIEKKELIEKELETITVIDQSISSDPTKCYCYACKNTFPKQSMKKAIKEDKLISVERTTYNGIAIRDVNHYKRIEVLVCPECAKSIQNYKDDQDLKSIVKIALPIIVVVILSSLDFGRKFNDIMGTIVLIVAIVALFIFGPIKISNKRRFVILKK